MKGSLLLLGIILFIFSPYAIADEYPPTHMCFKPEPPLFLASRRHQKRYHEDIKRYEICMKEFIQEQQESIRMHQVATEQAQSELNKLYKK